MPRRRFLQNAGAAAAVAPFLAAFADALGGRVAQAQASGGSTAFPTHNPWPKYPAYRFAMVSHRTGDPFFVPTRIGANDASALLGTSYTWGGSASEVVSEMVATLEEALDNQVDGIALCVFDPKAFNSETDEALSRGIPVVAFNVEAPAGSGNNAMAYVGQDHFAAGVALAERAKKYLQPGDTVGAMIATPSSHEEQSRVAGAMSVFKAVGAKVARVVVGTNEQQATANIEAWYSSHPGARFVFASAGYNGAALADAVEKLGLSSKGVRAAAFDVGGRVLQAVNKGTLAFTLDEQAYLQGFVPLLQLFLYNISGGLISPFDVDTGHKLVTRQNVGQYLLHRDTWEGSSTIPVVLTPPKSIRSS
ncbi:MAG: substrate-binding domain-containing protein [Actinomycetota bacterium]|jgi:simple sugar transport system substrate-binding protein|nr:substrate-binding domain-containing protein [Actinomycetota bacterium]